MVDATDVVASVDLATGTVVLQGSPVLRPGTQIFIRNATPVAVQPGATVSTPEWRPGTVRTVDRASGVLGFADGRIVRVGPNTIVRWGNDRIGLDRIMPGTEIVTPFRAATAGPRKAARR